MTWDDMNELAGALQRDGYKVLGVGDLHGEWEIRVTGRIENRAVIPPDQFTLMWVTP